MTGALLGLSLLFQAPLAAQAPASIEALLDLKQEQLDALYAAGASGEIPDGKGRGKAIFFPGSLPAHPLASLAALVWQGKVFNVEEGILVNKILGFKAIRANVLPGLSWFDGKPAIIIDYQDTAPPPISRIRDEIRLVAPGLYLGRAYLRADDAKAFILNFALDFNPKP